MAANELRAFGPNTDGRREYSIFIQKESNISQHFIDKNCYDMRRECHLNNKLNR